MMVKLSVLLAGGVMLSGCATSSNSKYQDTSELERPPQLEIVAVDPSADNQASEERKASSRLGQTASLTEDNLTIALPIEQAWKLVELGLKLNKLEISDRNRDKGQYYVEFDPDNADVKSNAEEGYFDGLFAENKYPKGKYALTLTEKTPRSVTVKAELLESSDDHSAQDGYAGSTATDSGSTKLLQRLYTTLHDELPLD
jgi:uncharacterized lipoprotein